MLNYTERQDRVVQLFDEPNKISINAIWPAKHLQDHFKGKLHTVNNDYFKFFFELSYDNQRIMLNHLNKIVDKENVSSQNTSKITKPTIKDRINGQINVMYFFANHKHGFLDDAFKDTPQAAAKYNERLNRPDINAKKLYGSMEPKDKETLLNYIDKNYCAFNHFKSQSRKI